MSPIIHICIIEMTRQTYRKCSPFILNGQNQPSWLLMYGWNNQTCMDVTFAVSKSWYKSRTAGADQGFLERGFICIRVGVALLILSHFS